MISKQLAAKYNLFDSLEEMLAPETLSELLTKPVTQVECAAPEVWGNAGSEFIFVDTNVQRLVIKTMSMESDYEMFVTDDYLCRAVTLWQYGLLDQVRPHLAHEIIACAHENGVWAILMPDLSGHFLWEKGEQGAALMFPFLDGLARMHAEFWNDERLHDARLGLEDVITRVNLVSPSLARKHNNGHWTWIPGGVIGGWEILEKLLDRDVMSHMRSLIENPGPLLDALQHYPYTLLHGDPYRNNLAHISPDRVIAVDWQMAMRSLMTVDLARLVLNFSIAPAELAEAQAYYRRCLEGYLHKHFKDPEWQVMVDLGILTEVLTIACFPAYFMERADDPRQDEMWLKACNQLVRDGVRWL